MFNFLERIELSLIKGPSEYSIDGQSHFLMALVSNAAPCFNSQVGPLHLIQWYGMNNASEDISSVYLSSGCDYNSLLCFFNTIWRIVAGVFSHGWPGRHGCLC